MRSIPPVTPDDSAARLVVLARQPVTDLPERVAVVNRRLAEAGSGWRLWLVPEQYTQPVVVPIELTYDPAAADLRKYSGAGSLVDLLVEEGLQVGSDPLSVGSPAYKPGALTRGDFGRVPVKVLAPSPPRRRSHSELAGIRRPVIALLDTTVQPHPWLGPPDEDLDGDGFWVDARSNSRGWNPGPWLDDTASAAGKEGKLGRELGPQEGHGTFSAGLIRQVAPDAKVLAVHVMRDGGLVYAHHVLNALGWLLDWLVAGDVVCLPFGFRPVRPTDNAYLEWLEDVLGKLRARGVTVVAAAGNDGEPYAIYPAAFAKPGDTSMVSVGALNTNGRTHAAFSNYGDWVTEWEVGTSLVSTFPAVDGAARSELFFDREGDGKHWRESADPDDFTGLFARWSGTSFAAAVYAGRRAQERVRPGADAGHARPA